MKNFRVKLIIKVILLTANLLLISYFAFKPGLILIAILLSLIATYQFVMLLKSVDETNRELSRFLLSIKYSDFSQTFSNKKFGKSFKELNDAFNGIILQFQKTKREKEEHGNYLQTVIQHVGIGLISFREDGKIEFINNAAKTLLKVRYLNKIWSLNKLGNNLGDKIFSIQPDGKSIITISVNDEIIQLIINSTKFKLQGQKYKLVSLQNIQNELEEKEMDAWQKLIRVLTHEIMNSVTPISSLAGTIDNLIANYFKEYPPEDSETVKDVKSGLSTIQKRSKGLINFIEKYRSLVKIPKPNIEKFNVKSLFNRLQNLFRNEFSKYNIKFNFTLKPESIELNADQEQVEQILINLLLNAIYAVKTVPEPEIKLVAFLNFQNRVNIIVSDNGAGISKEIQEKIFIPFYTTKKEGSGIGLSLSKQIMRSHGGTIRVTSDEASFTSFVLKF